MENTNLNTYSTIKQNLSIYLNVVIFRDSNQVTCAPRTPRAERSENPLLSCTSSLKKDLFSAEAPAQEVSPLGC